MAKTAAERQREKRKRDTVTEENVTDVTNSHPADVTPEGEALLREIFGSGPASLGDYLDDHGRKYATRAEPDKLNWGPWMNSQQLAAAGLKANRVPIPGDWDYRPEPVKAIEDLTDAELQIRLKSYEGASWVNSPEHKEVLRRRAAQPTGAWT